MTLTEDKKEFRTVIVHGVGPCGKSHHAEDMARALGCQTVVDNWDVGGSGGAAITPGALHLTQFSPLPRTKGMDGVLILPIESALAAAFVLGAI